jgi:hypothetical protein
MGILSSKIGSWSLSSTLFLYYILSLTVKNVTGERENRIESILGKPV